ncbi:Hypothetical predicted protein [Pelobates cultripes]|uniref:Uncharacterized protein n=1 Tax=Pelobates cultripes TaxID=61616 RepID=A0AAD1SQD8_PELCU|nr:Hypothetical predicted protein [Pelobates cultripes]
MGLPHKTPRVEKRRIQPPDHIGGRIEGNTNMGPTTLPSRTSITLILTYQTDPGLEKSFKTETERCLLSNPDAY